MPKFVKPFRMGDVVQKVSAEPYSAWPIGQDHIIREAQLNQGTIQYSTNRGAWHDHDSFKLIRECDEKSMRELIKWEQQEYGDEW